MLYWTQCACVYIVSSFQDAGPEPRKDIPRLKDKKPGFNAGEKSFKVGDRFQEDKAIKVFFREEIYLSAEIFIIDIAPLLKEL